MADGYGNTDAIIIIIVTTLPMGGNSNGYQLLLIQLCANIKLPLCARIA
jgi:hypothetical protein